MARAAVAGELTIGSGLALARESDDAELRALLRRSVIPGAVRVAMTREPDYFAAEGLAGSDDVTLVARERGQLVGIGRCSTNRLYRNGTGQRVSYLGELRVDPAATHPARLLRDGYEFLATHTAETDGFFTSIASDNVRARKVLERGERLGLPSYRMLCDLVTLVIPVGRGATARLVPNQDTAVASDFMDQQSRRYHLALTWNVSRWRSLARHGVTPASIVVAARGTGIHGVAIIWDQRAFRQIVIDGYDWPVRLARPLYNGAQWLRGMAPLPAPDSPLAQGMLLGAFVDEPDGWSALWPLVQQRARTMDLSWVTVARQANDPELDVLRRFPGVREYHTSLYAVDWRDGPRWADDWDARPFRPEVSLL